MTAGQWARVEELFHEALNQPPEERLAWLQAVCGADTAIFHEVQSLLASDRTQIAGVMEFAVKQAVLAHYETATSTEIRRAGPYRLLKEIGQGGMGTVYLAERDDEHYKTKVAVKLVRPGMDTEFILHRFRRERQTLAHLQHPNIARLLDGGTTESGLPYIVMEYVQGSTISAYCKQRSSGVRETVRLFLDVCAAVDYAHRNFVIHRDLKPGNILVDEMGCPKLLDFGICKLLSADLLSGTETIASGMRLLTPDYASPEQIRGERITIASDIYSLGALLYELLTGTSAHRIEKYTPTGLERAICEREVIPPSQAAGAPGRRRQLKGDLDTILLRALEKEPERRYASAQELKEDLTRYLEYVPIRARPATLWYKTQKLWQRNQPAAVATGGIAIALLVGTVVSLREAKVAEQRFAQIRGLANKFVFDVHDAIKDLPGSLRAREMIVQTGLQYLNTLASDAKQDWPLQSELAGAYRRIGDIQGSLTDSHLGNTEAALISYRKAVSLADAVAAHTPDNPAAQSVRISARRKLGDIYAQTRAVEQAVESYRDGIRLGEAWLQKADERSIRLELADLYENTSDVLSSKGDYLAARDNAKKAVDLLERLVKNTPEDRKLQLRLASVRSSAGAVEILLGRLQEALAAFRGSAQIVDKLVSFDPANAAYRREQLMLYGHIGDVLGNPGMPNLADRTGSVKAYERSVDSARALHEIDPADQRAASDYAIALSRLATVIPNWQQTKKIAAFRESLAVLKEINRVNPKNQSSQLYLAFNNLQLGDIFGGNGDWGRAKEAYSEGLRWGESTLHGGTAGGKITFLKNLRGLGEAEAASGNRAKAIELADRTSEFAIPAGISFVDRLTAARAEAARGFIFVRLAAGSQGNPSDWKEARDSLDSAVTTLHKLQDDARFGAPHRKELQEAETVLNSLKGGRL